MKTYQDGRDLGAFIPSVLDDFGLPPFEFRIYCRIVRRAGAEGCYESVDHMAQACGINRKSVFNALKNLVKHRLIKKESRLGRTSTYTLTPSSEWIPFTPTCTKNGTPPPIPQTVQVPVPKSEQGYTEIGTPPIPKSVHEGSPVKEIHSRKSIEGLKKSKPEPDRLAGEENFGLTGEEDLSSREESEISPLVKEENFKSETSNENLALQKKEKSSAKKERKGSRAENAPLSHASDRWVQSTVIAIYDAHRAKKWRAAGVGEWNAGILSGLEQFLARANGDRVEAYKLLGMSIAAMAKDSFWGDKPLSMNQVLKYDPTASSSNFCGQWLGAAIETEERRNDKVTQESIPNLKNELASILDKIDNL